MGLEGDPAFPFKNAASRPVARVAAINRDATEGTTVTLNLSNGETKKVNEFTIAPPDVWEFTDASFKNVMDRERVKQEREAARAESAMRRSATEYRGDTSNNLQKQVDSLRKALEEERQLTRNFHNTYIASLHELANDVCKLDSTGKNAQFCRTFNQEFEKMQARAESGVYRGRGGNTSARKQKQDEDFFSQSDDAEESLSEAEFAIGDSDYF